MVSLAVRRAAARLCLSLGWQPLHEVPIPNSRRCDLLALRPDGGFVCIEVKSGVRDFLADRKWSDYHAFCDQLFFAVDETFPAKLIPTEVGLIVACVTSPGDPVILRDAPTHKLAPSRRRALLLHFAMLAAGRLSAVEDPAATAAFRTALRAE
jgi:hypothetical protein